MECRVGCGACCVAPSISSPIPGMPQGKRAGERCARLDVQDRCQLFGRPERPRVCLDLQPEREFCGDSAREGLTLITALELATR